MGETAVLCHFFLTAGVHYADVGGYRDVGTAGIGLRIIEQEFERVARIDLANTRFNLVGG